MARGHSDGSDAAGGEVCGSRVRLTTRAARRVRSGLAGHVRPVPPRYVEEPLVFAGPAAYVGHPSRDAARYILHGHRVGVTVANRLRSRGSSEGFDARRTGAPRARSLRQQLAVQVRFLGAAVDVVRAFGSAVDGVGNSDGVETGTGIDLGSLSCPARAPRARV